MRSVLVLVPAGVLIAGLFALPTLEQRQAVRAAQSRVDRLESHGGVGSATCPGAVLAAAGASRARQLSGALASWQSVGGCGAGASTGAGSGIKWVGRNVTGGLFNAQCQGSYAKLEDGYTYGVSTLVNSNVGEKWNLAVSMPWLYKYWRDPFGFGFDLSNQGMGDVSMMVTRRLGAINATSVTTWVGAPTGGFKANYMGGDPLRQDKQMGHGKYTGGVIVDHIIDNDWGPLILGGTLDYRGGENALKSYRSPAGSVYTHAAYLLGPMALAGGLTVNKFLYKDKDQGREQDSALLTIAPSASLEWATDYFALLLGGAQPFDTSGNREPWIVSLGLSVAPF